MPPTARGPLHPPDAVHPVALVELQLRLENAPLAMLVGLAVNVTVGAGATVTVAARLALPPMPVQVSVNVVVAMTGPVDWVPLFAFVPVQPSDARHVVASVDPQVKAEATPLDTVVGLAVIVTEGTGAIVTVAVWLLLPPSPVQVNVKDVFALSAPVDSLPLVAFASLHPPDAVHAVASTVLHVSSADPPFAMVAGLAASVTDGAPPVTTTVAAPFALPPGPVQLSV